MKKHLLIAFMMFLLLLIGGACAGEEKWPTPTPSPGEVTGNTYSSSYYGFSIDYPEGWDVEEDYLGAAVAFLGPDVDYGAYMVNITVVVEELLYALTLDEYVRAAIVQLKRVHPSLEILEEGTTTIGGEDAYVHVVSAYLDQYNVSIKDKQVVIVKGARAFVVTYDVTESSYLDYLDHANMAIQSFKLD